MNLTNFFRMAILAGCSAVVLCCGRNQESSDTRFTKTDSLTDTYLALQDSMLEAWNVMIHDDNHKIKAMQNLLHELRVSGGADPNVITSFSERIASLEKTRYTQKTLANPDVVEEYDFASNALVSELIALAESQRQFAYNSTMQKLVDHIRTADSRTVTYREAYDGIAMHYNEFIERNSEFLKDLNSDSTPQRRPLFQMDAE